MEATKKTKILVVEDDNLFRWTLNHFLQKEGYEVYPVASGESALDMANDELYLFGPPHVQSDVRRGTLQNSPRWMARS